MFCSAGLAGAAIYTALFVKSWFNESAGSLRFAANVVFANGDKRFPFGTQQRGCVHGACLCVHATVPACTRVTLADHPSAVLPRCVLNRLSLFARLCW